MTNNAKRYPLALVKLEFIQSIQSMSTMKILLVESAPSSPNPHLLLVEMEVLRLAASLAKQKQNPGDFGRRVASWGSCRGGQPPPPNPALDILGDTVREKKNLVVGPCMPSPFGGTFTILISACRVILLNKPYRIRGYSPSPRKTSTVQPKKFWLFFLSFSPESWSCLSEEDLPLLGPAEEARLSEELL